MPAVETIVAAIIFTVIGVIASHITWMKIYAKEMRAFAKKNPKMMVKDMKMAMGKTVVMTFLMGLGFTIVFEWAQAGLAAYGAIGGALLGAALWITFPFALEMVEGAWFNMDKSMSYANLLHWLLTLIVGGYAVAWYMGL